MDVFRLFGVEMEVLAFACFRKQSSIGSEGGRSYASSAEQLFKLSAYGEYLY